PLSICEVERVRRSEAMDELKRALDIAEDLAFPRMIFHMGGTRETADPRKRDAAFSSLEHLMLHARHVGVTICVENTASEMGDPAYLRAFKGATRISRTDSKRSASKKGLRRCASSFPACTFMIIMARKTSIYRLMTAASIGRRQSKF